MIRLTVKPGFKSFAGVSYGAMLVALAGAAFAQPALAQTAATPTGPGVAAAPQTPSAPAAAAPPATAGLQDIVVTARRVTERLQDVPLSVTAIGALQARDAHIASAQDLKGTIPNVNVQKSSVPGSGLLQIRGVELGSIPFTGVDTRVGVYIDGVYLGRTVGNSLPLADLERVEVLKGPQGTLFGKNETGGAINFITAHPTGTFGGAAEGGFGNYGRQHYRIMLNSPTFGDFSARVSYVRDRDNGDIVNSAGGTAFGPFVNSAVGFNDQPTPAPYRFNAVYSDSVFAALRYEHGGLTVDYKFDYSHLKDSAAPYQALGFPGSFVGCIGATMRFGLPIQCGAIAGAQGLNTTIPYTSAAANNAVDPPISLTRQGVLAQDTTGYQKVTHWGQSLTIQYVASDALTIKSITGYRHLSEHQQSNEDGAALFGLNDSFNSNVAPFPPYPTVGATVPPLPAGGVTPFCLECSDGYNHQHEWSEEFQLIGRPTSWLEYVAGAYYFDEHPSQTYMFVANVAPAYIFEAFGPSALNGIPPLTSGANPVGNNAFDNGDNSSIHSISRALYAHATSHFGAIDFAVGARYTQDRKTNTIGAVLADRTCVPGTTVDPTTGLCTDPVAGTLKTANNRFTYEASLTYKITPDLNAYVRYATAYLAGGAVRNIPFLPETAKAIEGGIKSEWFNRRLRLNVAGFYQDSTNAQNNINEPPYGEDVVINQGYLKTAGFEFEAAAVVAPGLTVSANGGYVHQEFADGERNSVPRWSDQFAATYDSTPIWNDAHIQLKLDANYRSHYYSIRFPLESASSGNFDGTQLPASVLTTAGFAATPAGEQAYLTQIDNASRNGGYWLANGRLSLVDISVGTAKGRLSGFVQNMFNSKGIVQGQNLGVIVGAVFETARRYGLDFTVNF